MPTIADLAPTTNVSSLWEAARPPLEPLQELQQQRITETFFSTLIINDSGNDSACIQVTPRPYAAVITTSWPYQDSNQELIKRIIKRKTAVTFLGPWSNVDPVPNPV